jgi:hypothetical protein
MKKAKSWTEKLNCPKPHEVKPAPMDIAGMKAGQIMFVPTPRIIDEFIRGIPRGQNMDVKTLRNALARKFNAEVTCPIYTGFHLRTVAEAAFEAYNNGTPLQKVTPVWRVLGSGSPTLKKLSYDTSFITEQRAQEGLAP